MKPGGTVLLIMPPHERGEFLHSCLERVLDLQVLSVETLRAARELIWTGPPIIVIEWALRAPGMKAFPWTNG